MISSPVSRPIGSPATADRASVTTLMNDAIYRRTDALRSWAVCAAEWRSILADTIVETHDRITGRTDRAAMRRSEARIANEATAAREDLTSFAGLGNALIKAHETGEGLDVVIAGKTGWESLNDLVTAALHLPGTMEADPLDHVAQDYNRFRRYTPRMLRVLDIQAALVTQPLLRAV